MDSKCTVVGGGLAGAEAVCRLSAAGIPVTLCEMKPAAFSAAHTMPGLCELVCSNSLKAERLSCASGLLKAEMELFGSVVLECARECRVPAGGALAVDREELSRLVTRRVESDPLVTIVRGEVRKIPGDGVAVIAAGPLVSDALADDIRALCGGLLSFYDAASPIVTAESIDMSQAFTASRYDRGGESDYINCPMNREEYEKFYSELVRAERAVPHGGRGGDDKRGVYEGCMPIEVMADRGADTIRFGPLRPVGLRDPVTLRRPWAVLQLRREDSEGRLFNLVGFQTNLKFGEQKRVFSLIPALRNAEFVRYGVMHRNTFIDSPRLLNADLSTRRRPSLFFAGQITGVEGYMESAASGILAGVNAANLILGRKPFVPPPDTMMGALARHVASCASVDFQPMGANFGILPPTEEKIKDKKLRYEALSARALSSLSDALGAAAI